jgi:rubrerythrin
MDLNGSAGRCVEPHVVDGLHSRREVARRFGALLVGGVLLVRSTGAAAAPALSKEQDARIFNFALLLEHVQAAFYAEGVSRARLRGEVREFAETVAEHEREHVAFLKQALGAKARPKPSLHFGEATTTERRFVESAMLLENLGVSAYNGQAANLTKPALAAAVEIVSVEGRHAAWISDLAGREPAPRAADPGASAAEVVAKLRSTGFVR